MEWHESLVESGEIADWRASCNRYSFDMTVSEKGLST